MKRSLNLKIFLKFQSSSSESKGIEISGLTKEAKGFSRSSDEPSESSSMVVFELPTESEYKDQQIRKHLGCIIEFLKLNIL